MYAKYCKNKHPIDIPVKTYGTKTWKYTLKMREVAEEKIIWFIGEGNVLIYKDKWINNLPMGTEEMAVKELFYSDGLSNDEKINEICGMGVMNDIKQKGIHISEGKDQVIWTLNSNGKFALSSAWELVRQKKPQCMIGKYI